MTDLLVARGGGSPGGVLPRGAGPPLPRGAGATVRLGLAARDGRERLVAAVWIGPSSEAVDLAAQLLSAGLAECTLLDAEGTYRGLVRLVDLVGQPGSSTVDEHARTDAVVFDERTTLSEAMERLRGFVGDAAAVVSSVDGRLLGVAPESAIIEAYLDRVRELRREENEAL